jgi:hypothetical protein
VNTSIRNQPGIHNIESPEQDLTIPDLRNVLITHTVTLNGISATALIDSGAQEDFIDTNFVLAYNMATTTTSCRRYVSLANGTRQDAGATLRDARMIMTTRPEEGYLQFELYFVSESGPRIVNQCEREPILLKRLPWMQTSSSLETAILYVGILIF